jgi:hypothetical protein
MTELKGMTSLRRWTIGSALGLASVTLGQLAHADMMLVSETGLVSGSQSTVYTLVAPSAGSVTISLSNLSWPDPLASLSFALTTSTGVLKTMDQAGQMTIDLSGAGTYYALVSGIAQGKWDMGLYSLTASFSALPGGPEVPLPAAVWLLLSGLALTWGVSRKQMLSLPAVV